MITPEGRPVTGATRVAGVIGDPVAHSLSPALHNAAYAALGLDWVYVAFPVPAGQAAGAVAGLRAMGLVGLSVTMPHKSAVAGLVDRLTPVAERLAAVNTLRWEGPTLVGDSTDAAGFLDSLKDDQVDPRGMKCAVVGAGGAARAVVLALAGAGAGEVIVVNRSPGPAERAAGLAAPVGRPGAPEEIGECGLVVNATPVGMGPDGGLPVDPERLGAGQVVVDLIYHPETTPLLAAARARGATAIGGLGMLVHQAGHQVRAWSGLPPPLEAMAAAARAEVARSSSSG